MHQEYIKHGKQKFTRGACCARTNEVWTHIKQLTGELPLTIFDVLDMCTAHGLYVIMLIDDRFLGLNSFKVS